MDAFLKVASLKNNSGFQEMKQNAINMVNKAFNWKNLLKDYYKLYYSVYQLPKS
ncbi:MAG: hypothetical protein IT236_14625 [Bacteroidia bacterium]|nr:hypothetical protein [Bacteroidia bacterium]